MSWELSTTPEPAAASDLITTARAIQNAAMAKLNASAPDTLAALITAASGAICRACHRDFVRQPYTHYLSGGGFPYQDLYLPEIPVASISRLAANPTPAIRVTNADRATNQRATVATTSTGLVLARVASGVSSSSTITFTVAPTLQAMADAIVALGSGWAATVAMGYGLWPSADLRPLQGALPAVSAAPWLELYTEDLPADQWRLEPSTGLLSGYFPQGSLNVRVDYVAGFEAIPEDVQQACVQLAADLHAIAKRDNTLAGVKIGPFAKTYADPKKLLMQSATIKSLLSTYVDHAKVVGL